MQEIRKIIFSNDELFSAFKSFSRKTPNFLPVGKLISCSPVGQAGTESEIVVKIQKVPDDPATETELSYRGADVLQPLILFCLENNIMLPRNGRKAFLVTDSHANLVVDLNQELDLVYVEDPMTSKDIGEIKG
jgi:hypothetical protein